MDLRKSGAAVDWRRHFFYWMLPSLIVLIYIAMYFSGQSWLRNLVASPANREFGLLENTQNLIILATAGVAVAGFRRVQGQMGRALFLLVALCSIGLLLEEIDYGLHYWELFVGIPIDEVSARRNLHNFGDLTNRIKQLSDTVMILFFVLLPLLSRRVPEKWRFFLPEKYAALTAVCAVLISKLAHGFADAGYYTGGPISHNISEFREVFTYYIWLLYFTELVFHRSWRFGRSESSRLS